MTFTRDFDDEYIAYLNRRGFVPILQPTGGLEPGTIYLVDRDEGRCLLHGSLQDMLPPSDGLDAQSSHSAEFEDAVASHAEAAVSISLFERVMKFFGAAGGAKLDAEATTKADTLFSFANVKSLLVEPSAIEAALNARDSEKKPRHGDEVSARFTEEELADGRVHVAYEYLYSDEIVMRVGDQVASSIGLDASLTNEAHIKAEAGAGRKNGTATLYDGKEPVAFAFKLAQIRRENDRYFVRAKKAEGAGYGANDAADDLYIVETARIFEIEAAPGNATG